MKVGDVPVGFSGDEEVVNRLLLECTAGPPVFDVKAGVGFDCCLTV